MMDRPAYEAHLARGRLLRESGRNAEACIQLGDAIQADPDRPEAYFELGLAKSELPGRQTEALQAIDRAISLEPNSAHYIGTKAYLQSNFGQHLAALQTQERALQMDPWCHIALLAQANAYTKLKRWTAAEQSARLMLETHPHDTAALNLLAQTLRLQDRGPECRVVIAQILALTPHDAFGHANAGYEALKTNDPLRAKQHFLESLRADPHYDFARGGLLQSLRERNWLYRFNRGFLVAISGNPGSLRALIFILGICTGGIIFGFAFLYMIIALTLQPLSNFFLLFNPAGRSALTAKERFRARLTGASAILVLVVLAFTRLEGLLFLVDAYLLLFGLGVCVPHLFDAWRSRRETKADRLNGPVKEGVPQ
jgi:tetratricopeptide (TPR) repeat protein